MNLADLQQTTDAWAHRNCDALPENWAFDHAALVAEEAGELLRHAIKGRYGYPGTQQQWQHAAQEEVGDVIVAAVVYAAAEGFDADACVQRTLRKLQQRDGNYRVGLWRKPRGELLATDDRDKP